MEDWETSLPVVLDTIKVTVKAFADGKVELKPVPDKTRTGYIRQAPEFATGCGEHLLHIYTAITLGEFLGWLDVNGKASKRLLSGLNALELIELDCINDNPLLAILVWDINDLRILNNIHLYNHLILSCW